MALEKSDAIVLKSFNWSESSRTVVFFTRRFGRLALVDRGGRSLKSRRGRVMPFCLLEVTFYHSDRETRGYLSEVGHLHAFDLAGDGGLGRLAYASAACELLNLLLPEEQAHEDLFDYLNTFFTELARVPTGSLPAVFVCFYLRLMSFLGYHPSLGHCCGCGRQTLGFDEDQVAISLDQGGTACLSCQRSGEAYIGLSARAFAVLVQLQTSSLAEASGFEPLGYRTATAAIDVLTRILAQQAGLSAELKSLAFIDKLKHSHVSEQSRQHE